MAGVRYGNRGGRIRGQTVQGKAGPTRTAEEVVRELKAAQPSGGADYRERSLALHGLVCGRCGREFAGANRGLLTVHHRDGNHHNNPPDGSNWENLCVYCHEDVHSRGLLADYIGGAAVPKEEAVVYRGEAAGGAAGLLADKLKQALEKKRSSS